MEFTTVPATMTRKELIDSWISLISSLARSPGILRRLLDLAKTLNDEQLDRPLNNQIHVFPRDGPDQSLRQLLDRMVQTKEAWADSQQIPQNLRQSLFQWRLRRAG
jgi:hypothetical protein